MLERLIAAFKLMGMDDATARIAAIGSGVNPKNDRTSFPNQPSGGGYNRSEMYDQLERD